jgi:hypothetical protein
MKKRAILLIALVLGLLISLSIDVHTVNAQSISTDVEFGSPFTGPTFVNQPVEFIATSSGGTPPYTYQWYTQLWPTWKPGMSLPLSPLGSAIAVPGATSSKFEFVESTPGSYSITLKVTDSTGEFTYCWFLSGLWVFVLPLSTPSPSDADTAPPSISFLSPENKTYSANDILLNFTLSEPANWIGYSMDAQTNITIDGNTTLTGLLYGSHNVTIYANDTYGNTGKSETTPFTIDQPASFPTTEAAAATTIAIASAALGLGYVMKRKHRTVKQ